LASGGSFIQIDRQEADRLEKCLVKKSETEDDFRQKTLAERKLLHEGKHYNNGDHGKRCMVFGLAYAPVLQAVDSCKKLMLPNVLLRAGFCFVVVNMYGRYQEEEADRFAFMNLSSIKKLEISKANCLRSAEIFENNLLINPLWGQRNRLEKMVRPILSRKLHSLNQRALECSDDQKKLINIQKNRLIKIADYIFDPEHHDARRRVAIAQECLDKRKEDHKE
jgi:hypothetical protein